MQPVVRFDCLASGGLSALNSRLGLEGLVCSVEGLQAV